MDVQEIEVTIDNDGHVMLHVRGVQGDSCLELTKELEKVLGGNVLSREMTPEALDEPGNLIDQDLNIKGSQE